MFALLTGATKLNHEVKFPHRLNMKPYTLDGAFAQKGDEVCVYACT